MRTPIAAIFSRPTQTPVRPSTRVRRDAVVADRPNQHVFEIAHVAVDVAAIRVQVDDRIADDLAGPVIGDVAAAAGFENLDAAGASASGSRQDVRASTVAADAERQDVGMFDEEQQVAERAGPAILDQRALQRRALLRTERRPRPPRLLQTTFGSQFSSDRFTIDMNSSATAPSMTR